MYLSRSLYKGNLNITENKKLSECDHQVINVCSELNELWITIEGRAKGNTEDKEDFSIMIDLSLDDCLQIRGFIDAYIKEYRISLIERKNDIAKERLDRN